MVAQGKKNNAMQSMLHIDSVTKSIVLCLNVPRKNIQITHKCNDEKKLSLPDLVLMIPQVFMKLSSSDGSLGMVR